MPSDTRTTVIPSTPLTALTTWLKHRWAAFVSANENPFTIVGAETIGSTDGSSYMRWAVVTRR